MSGTSSLQSASVSANAVEASMFQMQAAVEALPTTTLARPSKRAFDLIMSLGALAVLSVLFAMIAVAILILDGRPVFFRHRRVGKDGTTFGCLKFRTMARDADAALVRYLSANPDAMMEWQATRKLKRDPRITPIGRILRDTSLDELPQLLNIVRGEMSIVGPRPIVAEEVARYGAAITDYQSVRPGLTGLWQCSGRNDVSYEGRVTMDKEYVRNWSFWLDLSIVLRTVPAVMRSRGVY